MTRYNLNYTTGDMRHHQIMGKVAYQSIIKEYGTIEAWLKNLIGNFTDLNFYQSDMTKEK